MLSGLIHDGLIVSDRLEELRNQDCSYHCATPEDERLGFVPLKGRRKVTPVALGPSVEERRKWMTSTDGAQVATGRACTMFNGIVSRLKLPFICNSPRKHRRPSVRDKTIQLVIDPQHVERIDRTYDSLTLLVDHSSLL